MARGLRSGHCVSIVLRVSHHLGQYLSEINTRGFYLPDLKDRASHPLVLSLFGEVPRFELREVHGHGEWVAVGIRDDLPSMGARSHSCPGRSSRCGSCGRNLGAIRQDLKIPVGGVDVVAPPPLPHPGDFRFDLLLGPCGVLKVGESLNFARDLVDTEDGVDRLRLDAKRCLTVTFRSLNDSFIGMPVKPRRSGRGYKGALAGTKDHGCSSPSCWSLLLFDVLLDDGDGCPAA